MTPNRSYQVPAKPTLEEDELTLYRLCESVAHWLSYNDSLTVEKWNEFFTEARTYVAGRTKKLPSH